MRLEQTLPHNRAALHTIGDDFEIVLINASGDLTALNLVPSQVGACDLRLIDVPCGRFNKACALNIGAFRSRCDRIIMVDADILISLGMLREGLALLGNGAFVTPDKPWKRCRHI